LSDAAVSEAGLESLAGFGLQSLHLHPSLRTGSALKHWVAAIDPNMNAVDLAGWTEADAGMKYLRELRHVTQLCLVGSDATAKGVASLHGMNLRSLALDPKMLTDDVLPHAIAAMAPQFQDQIVGLPWKWSKRGLQEVAKRKHLPLLNLSQAKLAPQDLAVLRGCSIDRIIGSADSIHGDAIRVLAESISPQALMSIGLASCPVTDRDVEHLATFSNLMHVALSDTKITDAAVASLARLRRLNRLALDNTEVSSAARHRLEDISPMLQWEGDLPLRRFRRAW
jgi:hypothetical protein